jgi:hypothetical protein
LIDVLAIKRLNILQFEDDLASIIAISHVSEKFVSTIVVKDDISDVSPALCADLRRRKF